VRKIVSVSGAVLSLITLVSVYIAISATIKKNLAEEEAAALRKVLQNQSDNHLISVQTSRLDSTNLRPAVLQKEEKLTTLQEQDTEQEEPERNWRPPRRSFAERMEQLKKDDPERYAEIMQRREEFQQQMKYDVARRASLLMNLESSNMTPEERAVHQELLERMGQIFKLTEQIQNPEDGMSREMMGELFFNIQEAQPLLEQERRVIIRNMGTDLGLSQLEAENLANYVEAVISATTFQIPERGGRGGPGGGQRGPLGGGRLGPGGH